MMAPGGVSGLDDTLRMASNRTATQFSSVGNTAGNKDKDRPYGCSGAFDKVEINDIRDLYPSP